MASFKATWLGDEDPAAQLIRVGDLRFIKGEAVSVPSDHPMADMIRDNPVFAIDDAKAAPTPADEPEQPEEVGTEKAALKALLRERGEEVRGNPSVETLRERLAKQPA